MALDETSSVAEPSLSSLTLSNTLSSGGDALPSGGDRPDVGLAAHEGDAGGSVAEPSLSSLTLSNTLSSGTGGDGGCRDPAIRRVKKS